MKIRRCLVKCNLVILSFVISLLLCGCNKKINSDGGKTDSVLQTDITSIPSQVEDDKSVQKSDVAGNTVTQGPTLSANEGNVDTSLAEFKDEVTKYLENKPFQGTVLIEKNGEIILKQAYGYANAEDKIPNETDTIYEIGSVTKQFTAVGIMMLVEDGLISLDDTLDKYLPEYPYASKITIRQLLNMTSGIGDYLENSTLMHNLGLDNSEDSFHRRMSKEITHEELLKYVSKDELQFKPGTQYAYSNTNYYLLGMIIEKLSGMSYDEYITTNILKPLGMSSTSFNPLITTATGYGKYEEKDRPIMSPDPTLSYAAFSICSNVDDMLLWENAVMVGKLLTKESWSEVFDGGEFGYGFGWGIEGKMYCHNGHTLGFNSFVSICPDNDYVIILLANTYQNSSNTLGRSIIRKFSKYLFVK